MGVGPAGREGREERERGFSLKKTLFKFVFQTQTRNHAFES
jgi:hypothetical protein